MPLRPRYSLLTLLILTALVAGGVKLWYGPHHVVDKHDGTLIYENEYNFTLDWHGKRIIQGTNVARFFDQTRKLESSNISYYRSNRTVCHRNHPNHQWGYGFVVKNPAKAPPRLLPTCEDNPLLEHERHEFQIAIDEERTRLQKLYPELQFLEGYYPLQPY